MALIGEDQGKKLKEQIKAGQSQQQNAGSAGPDSKPRGKKNMNVNLSKLAQNSALSGGYAPHIKTFVESLEKISEEQGSDIKVAVVKENLCLPVVLLTSIIDGTCVTFPLLIEEGSEALEPIKVRGEQNQMLEMPSSIYRTADADLFEVVIESLEEEGNANVHVAGYLVVPKPMKGEENPLTTEASIRAIYSHADQAIKSNDPEAPIITAGAIVDNNWTRVHNIQITPGGTEFNNLSQPVAADIVVHTTARSGQMQQPGEGRRYHNQSASLTLAKTTAIVDLVYSPDEASQNVNPLMLNQQNPQYHRGYNAVFAITSVSGVLPGHKVIGENPQTIVHAIDAIAPVIDSGAFINVFNNVANSGKASLGNLAKEFNPAIGHEPEGKAAKISKSPVTAGKGEVTPAAMWSAYVNDSVALALDITYGRPGSAAMKPFFDAAVGLDGANEALIAIFDEFYDGQFSHAWAEITGDINTPIMFPDQTVTILAGSWIDDNNNLRDLAAFDHTRLLEYFGDQPELMYEVEAAPGRDTEYDLVNRYNVISRSVPTAKCEGDTKRCLINGLIKDACALAASKCRLKTEVEGINDGTRTTQRGATVNNSAFAPQNRANMQRAYRSGGHQGNTRQSNTNTGGLNY